MKRIVLAAGLIVVVAACGSTGSVGPQGAQGIQGTAGQQGVAGSANVIYSAWFTPNVWTEDTVFSLFNFNWNQAAPAITQPILDSGVVLVYGKLNGYVTTIWPHDQVGLLPITLMYSSSGTTYIDTWSAIVTLGNVRINLVDNNNAYGGISNAHSFRYVIIPGGMASADRVKRLPKMTYEQVAQLFNIPQN
jgi:hypothetical protein